ncbi:MAG TPA: ATP-dependent DNA helicase RecG [Phycisphaerales bacterium]|nr:ATP-dependent DNA helicase RecG [Phycisphaerales bacterium]
MARPPLALTTPISQLGALGRRLAPDLAASLGVSNLGQLLATLPARHELLEAETTIDRLTPGALVTARGEIAAARYVPRGRTPRLEAVLMDHTGRLDLVWFNMGYMRDKVRPGLRVRVTGPARRRGPGLQVSNPRLELLDDEAEPPASDQRLRPIYPATESLPSRRIESLIRSVLPEALPLIEDHLPEEYRRARELPALADAYRMIHAPGSQAEAADARRRLAFDELLLLQLAVFLRRAQLRAQHRAPPLPSTPELDQRIRARFPFRLTPAQEEVIGQVAADLARPTPASRLIQGDVGSGKTAVALYAMLLAVAAGHQAALMAPTELLAEQHFASISELLAGSRVRPHLLTGSLPAAARRDLLASIASGGAQLVVGTHAVISQDVRFHSLALAIIDEQHRFGVTQRAQLRQRARGAEPDGRSDSTQDTGAGAPTRAPGLCGEPAPRGGPPAQHVAPHLLVMTATPIPRTLALTIYGDLDISTISGLPPGRSPITTRVLGTDKSAQAYRFLRERLDRGDQGYIVVPTIDPAGPEADSADSATDLRAVMARLAQGELAGKRLAALHGRLDRAEREHVMHRFRRGLIDALVATTVIEVGIDVPAATVMVIENADRFGLAQLHQLRGRIGRGPRPSVCLLLADPTTEDAAARLEAIATLSDGFALAERDAQLRGPGEVLGTRQAGAPGFKAADLTRDLDLLTLARRDAQEWIARSPSLDDPAETLLRRRLLKAHGRWLGLADVG